MVHDLRPALAGIIRSGANRRGAFAAVLGLIPLVSAGVMQVDAARSQRQGKRTAKSESKKKKKAIARPAGPQGPQGPQGPAGARGPEGPKAITSDLILRSNTTNTVPAGQLGERAASCNQGEIVVSGGFSVSTGMMVERNERQGNAWIVAARNTTTNQGTIQAFVYCLPV